MFSLLGKLEVLGETSRFIVINSDMILGVNIIGGKASEASNMRALQVPTKLRGLWSALSPQRETC